MIQHLVSQVLLRRFSNYRNGPISGLSLDSLEERTGQVKSFGGIQDPDLLAPDNTEKLWSQEVEVRLPYVFQLLDQSKLLSNQQAIVTVKNCMALHWARGFALRAITTSIIPTKADEVTRSLLAQFTTTQALHALTGLYVTHPHGSERIRQIIRAKFAEKLKTERFIDEQFLVQYRKAQELIEPHKLEIWFSKTDEFLVSDIPVISYNQQSDQVGILNGVSWDQASNIFMPLGPRHVVALSKTSNYNEADSRMVERLNVYQVRGAFKEIYYRPGCGLGNIIADALRRNQTNPMT